MKTREVLSQCIGRAGTVFRESGSACNAQDAALYLAHTGRGQSIRALAEALGKHPSTVLRAVRRVEERRDDPLIDRMLDDLEQGGDAGASAGSGSGTGAAPAQLAAMAEEEVVREARRYLRRLCEPGSFLLVADGGERAGVFCVANAHRKPIATFPVGTAAEFLRRDWIRIEFRGKASVRYRITDAGRAFLRRTLAEEAQRRAADAGFADAQAPFRHQHQLPGVRGIRDEATGELVETRVNLGENPLGWLGRRRGSDGRTFLTPAEVEAGERLRSDFERAQMGPSVGQDWRRFLTPNDRHSGTPVPRGPCEGPAAARERVTMALGVLGPGLSDVALRVCCFLEGLESCERRMGWSARSGKVVLKLALQRLAEHYGIADRRQ